MAEFKLGRIRFIWKDSWTASTTYYKDDIVKYGGNTFVCIQGHESTSDFDVDFSIYWNKLTDGQVWKSDWTDATVYKVNDIVKYGGYLYIANTEHTSNTLLENDQAKWDLYAEGFDWKNDWATETYYKENDIVKYNGITYLCITAHTSAATISDGLEVDQSKWQKFTEGLQWHGDWSTSTRYRVNDVVKYGAQLYVANAGHTSAETTALGLEADQTKWDYLHKGIEYKGIFSSDTRYKVNDVVKSGGGLWICINEYTSRTRLSQDESNWAQFVEGLEFEDSWNPTTNYEIGDIVTYGGYTYVATTNHIESRPTDLNDWDLFNTGFRFVGEWGIDPEDNGDSSAYEYKVGDVITHGGYTYLCMVDNFNQEPPNTDFWERLNEGFKWKGTWTDVTEYDLGDVVEFNSNSYIAVSKHTSAAAENRPDLDTDGSEWNLIAGGPENNVMDTEGDLVYYSSIGPTKLPIGSTGQILRVNDTATAPEWGFYGSINNIVYVDPVNGIDGAAPGFGTTIDRPFKSIKHAAYNVEEGYMRADSRKLIQLNTAFIQDETVSWVDAQIAAENSPFTSAFSYDKPAWRIYVGRLLTALLWDLGHGGNERTRDLTIDIYNAVEITNKTQEFAAAIEYAETVIAAVIVNDPPAATYGDGSFTQTIDNQYTEDFDAQGIIENLIDILTSTVIAQSTTDTPAETKPQNTLFVKTGISNEVLPITVPENTAVVGDELRSTKIFPASTVVNTADVPIHLDALSRLQAVMNNIVTNPGGITKTTGNALDTDTTHPAGSTAAGTEAVNLVQQISDFIDYGINGATGDSTVPLKDGSLNPQTSTDYTYAIESIEANREFIKAEIIAYVNDNYPAYDYEESRYEKYIDLYINSIKYDLIYTGNYKSLRAAEEYVNRVLGSLTENMFYMRNGTGLRNCTVQGLVGSLSAENSFGTKRPTAGAYVSLDPGWGPDDEDVWITNKSPYIQNVTTFGTGCIGLKVDGDLHAGGNDSIVANDFTQLVSDGIGVWVTNLGRSELVSVFSYYAHIGYLSENGGKIRATNGNSSYGDFGTVAEGVDNTEVPITGTVDNQATEAIIANVLTDGNNILTFEYQNAGVNYTSGGTTFTVTGEGFGAAINSVNTVNNGVFEVRLLNPSDNFGGDGYVSATNTAQTGDTTSITLSNTDIATSAAYVGMAVWIVSGTGAGQYGIVDSYNSGTKIATIVKASNGTSGWDHVTGAAIEAALDDTTEYFIEPAISFNSPPSGLYSDTTKARARVEDGKIVGIRIWDPGNGYDTVPIMTITDPNNTVEVPHEVRLGDGVLTQPTWTDRGTNFTTAQAEVSGDGYADLYQPGSILNVEGLTDIPQAGSNLEIADIPGVYFKIVAIRNLTGTGPYTATIQLSPEISITDAPEHGENVEFRIRYSQVRLTGHDFLDIGTGNFTNTNYPGIPLTDPDPDKETNNFGGGRVFYTSTDQDGNFRVGELFSVEQSTGIATLDADAFNLAGLQELQLGAISLGGTAATITEFSTDGTFTANSDNVVPTQKAIRTYIQSQIGGGSGELNVNQLTAGQVRINSDTITHTTGDSINITANTNFTGGINGDPVAMNYFLLS